MDGFSNARGADISVSLKGLKAVRDIFDKESAEFSHHSSHQSTNSTGFSTASGASVAVSKNSLEAVRSIFDMESTGSTEGSNQQFTNSTGFSTARGASVAVSKNSLETVRGIFDMESTESAEGSNHQSQSLNGFVVRKIFDNKNCIPEVSGDQSQKHHPSRHISSVRISEKTSLPILKKHFDEIKGECKYTHQFDQTDLKLYTGRWSKGESSISRKMHIDVSTICMEQTEITDHIPADSEHDAKVFIIPRLVSCNKETCSKVYVFQ